MNPDQTAPDPEVIICRVTPWFFRRMGILAAMLLFMGCYFIYDGRIGYRRDNSVVEKKAWFDGEFLKSFDEAKRSGRFDEWAAKARAAGLPAGENGEPPKWASYAAQFGWDEKPKRHSEEEILQQFEWGGAMLLLGLMVVGKILLDRGKTLAGYGDRMVMPGGAEVRFSEAFRVDKRKWDHKGLAYVHYRSGGVGKRAVVDDLKYDGAGRVLDRLLAEFKGELIEKIPEPDETPPDPPGGAGPASGPLPSKGGTGP